MRLCDRLEGVDPGRERWTGRQDPDPGGAYIRLGGGGEREAETRPRTLLSPIAAEVRDSGEAATVLAPSFPRWCSSTGYGPRSLPALRACGRTARVAEDP